MALVGSEPSLSLGGIAALPLPERSAFVHQHGLRDLDATMQRLRLEEPDAHRVMSVERLAWAVAFNVTGEHVARDARSHRGKRSYLDYWRPETPWLDVWSSLAAPLAAEIDRGSRTGLLELAASVACERRDDWQPPAVRPVRTEAAQNAFASLFDRDKNKVVAYISGQFRRRAGDPEDIAIEAWSRVFLDYWSGEARKRVLGTSAISSLVCGTAYFIGCDTLRRQKAEAVADDQRQSPSPRVRHLVAESPAERPSGHLAAAELEHHVALCREQLPARQQLAARMAWDYEMRQNEVARKLGVSAPAVSQLLEKARQSMKKCLMSKGLNFRESGNTHK